MWYLLPLFHKINMLEMFDCLFVKFVSGQRERGRGDGEGYIPLILDMKEHKVQSSSRRHREENLWSGVIRIMWVFVLTTRWSPLSVLSISLSLSLSTIHLIPHTPSALFSISLSLSLSPCQVILPLGCLVWKISLSLKLHSAKDHMGRYNSIYIFIVRECDDVSPSGHHFCVT